MREITIYLSVLLHTRVNKSTIYLYTCSPVRVLTPNIRLYRSDNRGQNYKHKEREYTIRELHTETAGIEPSNLTDPYDKMTLMTK